MRNKFKILTLFFLLFIAYSSFCQTLYGGLEILDQSELDNLPEYEHITGAIVIGDYSMNDPSLACNVHDLSVFRRLKTVGGLIIFRSDSLKNLDGLDSLQTIGGNFMLIAENNNLENTNALSHIKLPNTDPNFKTQLSIYKNPNLESLGHFERLDSIGHNFFIRDCPVLKSVDMPALKYIGGSMSFNRIGVEYLDLRSLNAFEQCRILDLPNLRSLEGLENISFIASNRSDISINDCPLIPDLAPLSNLKASKLLRLELIGNTNLKDISGFSFQDTHTGGVLIKDCPSLDKVCIPSMYDGYLGVEYCANVTEIRLDSMDTMKSIAIRHCPRLQSLDLPKVGRLNPTSDYSWGEGFISIENCDSLPSLYLPELGYFTSGFNVDSCNLLKEIIAPNLVYTPYGLFGLFSGPVTAISNCENLETINFRSLKFVGSSLRISLPKNKKIKNITGFDSLYHSNLSIAGLSIDSILGFSALKECTGLTFYIDSIDFIQEFHFDSLKTVIFESTFLTKNKLTFPALKSCNTLSFAFLRQQEIQADFPNLSYVEKLYSKYNEVLLSIDSLRHIQQVSANFYIQDNPKLTDCSAICEIMAHGLSNNAEFVLENNPLECLTLTAIQTYCDTVTTVLIPEIKNTKQQASLKSMPNPVPHGGVVRCQVTEADKMPKTLYVYDISGKLMKKADLDKEETEYNFSTEDWTSGMYIISIKIGQKSTSNRFILE